ncbi:ankyrin repeat domain-containing protein 26-like [Myotis yumanensis]|uniref:ankyrin repeat domain-containing protein 26-like n=1 Tax=Myotis yumanensis TaxID=159337 RepID=UPI0038D09F8B
MGDRADDDHDSIGLNQQSNKEQSDEMSESTVILVKKVEEKKDGKSSKREVSGNMDEGADDSGSGGLSQQSNSEQTDQQQVSIMKNDESDRFSLEEEKKKRQKVDLLYEKNRVQLRKKEEHSIKEVEMNPCLQTTIRTRDIVSKIVRENKVSESSGKEESRLHGNHMLWNEIAKLRLEIGTIKNQVQEMGKNVFEAIAIVKEKSDCLEKTKRKTVFQHNAELEVLRAELIMLNSKLEDEKQNRGRLEAEVESYRSRLATAVQDHEHCQTSKGDLQLNFQRARDEGFCLWDKMNSNMSNLKYNNEILSQQLSKLESKSNNLEIELHHTRDALKERTLDLERDLIQKQCQKEEIEHTCQKEQGKVDKDIGKQESLQEKLSHLQSENMLLRKQLDQAHNKADREEKTAINIQHQIQDKISIFNAECVKQIHMLNERINELINEWQLFKERIHQYENDHVEKNVPESSEKEESLLIENCILWDENAKLRLEINRAKNQKQEMEKEDVEDIALVKEKLDHLQKTIRETVFQHNEQLEVLRVENTVLNSKLEDEQQNRGRLEAEVESYRSRLATAVQDHEHCQTSKGDLQLASQTARDEGFCAGRSFYKPVENDELTAKVQPSSSKCIPLDEKKTPLQQLAMEALLKECEELENTAKKWEQENVNLRTHMEMNMVESCVAEEYKKNIEERTGRDEVDKYKQINSFLQRLRESQEMSEQMINNQDAKRSYLELRNKELKSELSRVQDSRDDRKKELEKYVQLYQEQVKGRKLLENELTDFHRTQERLAEVRTELLLETQDNRRPVLTAPCVGNLNNSFLPRRNSTPRENLDSPTSRSYTLTFQKDIAGFVERPWKCSFLLNLLE